MTRAEHIELPGLEPRGAIMAELDTEIGPLRVVGLHLGLIRRYRLLQIRAVMRHIAKCSPMPLLIAGDFNEWGNPAALAAAAPGLRFSRTPPTYPAPRPVARLDRIAHCEALRTVQTDVYRAKPAHIASDHLPVWAELAQAT